VGRRHQVEAVAPTHSPFGPNYEEARVPVDDWSLCSQAAPATSSGRHPLHLSRPSSPWIREIRTILSPWLLNRGPVRMTTNSLVPVRTQCRRPRPTLRLTLGDVPCPPGQSRSDPRASHECICACLTISSYQHRNRATHRP
jgi:hypothetical protein